MPQVIVSNGKLLKSSNKLFTLNTSGIYNTQDSTAEANDLLLGKTAYGKNGKLTGTIPTKTDQDITSSGGTVTIPAGYYAQQYTKQGDPSGDATLTSGDQMLNGVTAYSKGVKYTGTIPSKAQADVTVSGQSFEEATGDYAWKTNVSVPAGYYSSTVNIERTYSSVFPDPGAAEGETSDLLLGKKLFDHDGKLLVGTMPNNSAVTATISSQGGQYTIPEGYHNGSGVITASINTGALAATGSVTTSGSGSINPGANIISKNSDTNVSVGTVTTTKPGSGYYVAVDASTAQSTGEINVSGEGTAKATVPTAGYVSTSTEAIGTVTSSGKANVTVPAKAANTTYVPITSGVLSASGSVTVSGSGNVSAGTNTISKNSNTNVSTGTTTTTKPSSGYYVAVDASTSANSGSVSVSGTGTASASVTTAGYVGTSATGSGSVSGSGSASVTVPSKAATTTYVPITSAAIAASGSVTTSGSGSVNPGTNTISKNSNTNVSTGSITTTKPSSGYYVAVDASTAQNTGSISVSGTGTASASVSTAGYAGSSLTGSGSVSGNGSASVTVPAKSASTTYLPITSGALSAGSGLASAGGNITLGTATTTQPSSGYYVSATGSGSVSVGTAGYIASGTSKSSNSATKYYPISTATITNNTSGGTSSGTINSGSQIKIAKGWNNSDVYYTAQAARGTDKAAATYNTSTSDQTIAAGYYLTGAQTIKAVTTSGLTASNIISGAVVKVGDANSAGRIANVTGTADYVKTVSSVPASKDTSIIYNSTDGKYYIWK